VTPLRPGCTAAAPAVLADAGDPRASRSRAGCPYSCVIMPRPDVQCGLPDVG